jgi:uncharacterized membrane protein YphA (DoxX/SURF4 family)
MSGLYFMQILLIGVLVVKDFKYALLGLPLVVMTFVYHLTALATYRRPWSVMSLHDAARIDAKDKVGRVGVVVFVVVGGGGSGGLPPDCLMDLPPPLECHVIS